MQLVSIKVGVATAWVVAMCAAGIAAKLDSLPGWTVLAVVALLPPGVMLRLWSDPAKTLSESIQEAR